MYIENEAKKIIEKYHTNDPYALCDAMGIQVGFANIGSLRGVFHVIRRNAFITIHCDLCDTEKRACCAHELGHAVLHKEQNRFFLNSSLYSTGRFEREADEFGAFILWHDYQLENFEGLSLEQIKMETGIPLRCLSLILK
ncbi:MAG: ImmA/IrrE family metallo-endopeptidase [Eubacterium sp.]